MLFEVTDDFEDAPDGAIIFDDDCQDYIERCGNSWEQYVKVESQ